MKRNEEKLHRAAVTYLRSALPKPWITWHTPNGGGRSKAEAGILKALGVRAGMPDLFVMGPCVAPTDPRTRPYVVAIEFKAPPKPLKGGGLSKAKPRLNPAQIEAQADLGACGVPYLVIDDVGELHRALVRLGIPLRGRVP